MRGTLYPASNVIFAAQDQNPADHIRLGVRLQRVLSAVAPQLVQVAAKFHF
jgi:hypothetical protein